MEAKTTQAAPQTRTLDGNRPKNLDSKRNQEALRLGVVGTATKTRNTAWTCCPFAFCAHEKPAFVNGRCVQHSPRLHGCLLCHVVAGHGSALSLRAGSHCQLSRCFLPAQSPATAPPLALCPCCQHAESPPQVKHWRCPWVSARLRHPPCW